jgi:hypothetical protein
MLEVRGLTRSMTVNLTESPQGWPMTMTMAMGLSGLLFLQALRNKMRLKKADTTDPKGSRGISRTLYLSSEVLWSRTAKHCKHNDNCC